LKERKESILRAELTPKRIWGERMQAVTPSQLDFLKSIDTPTVCNIVEMVAPERRGHGYTVKHLFCPFPNLPPIVGFAKTVTAKAKDKVALGDYMGKRLDYLDYIASEPRPSIAVIEDLDDEVGYGAFWGEVQTTIHKGLGCLGVVTDGCVRDITMMAPGFQVLAGSITPSHAWVHLVDIGGAVNVGGMMVSDGDLIHADRHGAVVIPHEVVAKIPEAVDLLARRERVIIEASKRPGFSVDHLRQAYREQDDIH